MGKENHETMRSKRKKGKKDNSRVRSQGNSMAYLRDISADHGYCCDYGFDGDAYCDPSDENRAS
jgi:hypothetical protein